MQKVKTIWVLLRSHVMGLPPIITVLKSLLDKEVYHVNFISTQSSGIKHANFKEYICPQEHNVNKFKKLLNYIQYRSFVKKILSNEISTIDIIWLGSLDTALACKGLNFLITNQYILHLHELYDTHPKKLKSIQIIAKHAKHVVVPEINRAGILQVWLQLKERPIVLPNKPFDHPRIRKIEPTNDVTRKIISTYYKGKPILLYQGHISGDRNLMPIALAMKSLPDYEFWLLGTDHGYVCDLLNVSDNIRYLGSIPAPHHLEITSYATIGIMSYDLVSLNNLYCAPNKVWEYGGFGIPFIANDCLSLRDLFVNKIGIPVAWNEENIVKAVDVLKDSDSYRKNANVYFESVNLIDIINFMVK